MTLLHITNGDSANAYLKHLGIKGVFVAWQDVLHDGPITGETDLTKISRYRSEFLARYFCLPLKQVKEKFSERDRILNTCHDE